MLDHAFHSAKQLASVIRQKKVGCLEKLNFYLGRIERYNAGITEGSSLPTNDDDNVLKSIATSHNCTMITTVRSEGVNGRVRFKPSTSHDMVLSPPLRGGIDPVLTLN